MTTPSADQAGNFAGRRHGLDSRPSELRVGFVGFGALAQAFATGLHADGNPGVVVFTRPSADPRRAKIRAGGIRAVGARSCSSLEELAAAVDVVISAVPAAAAAAVAVSAAPHLKSGALYVDPSPLAPASKQNLADIVAQAGGEYVDVAVLGTVNVDGHTVPMAASGPGAERWASFAAPFGFRVSALDGPAGQASLVKLLRSVYMKGRDALILEMMVAARRHGVEETVVASIGGPAEQVPFPDLVARVLGSLALYAERRAVELDSAADLVAETGLEPLVSRAGAARLRWLADLGVRENFADDRPRNADAVLGAIQRSDVCGPEDRTGGAR